MAKLIVTSPGGNRVGYDLLGDVVTLGCAAENAIVLDEPTVSPRHAELRLQGTTYQVRDLGSARGTRVNGELVSQTILRAGDRIEFGAAEAWFEAEGKRPVPSRSPETAWEAAVTSARPVDFVNASPFRRRKKQRDPIRNAIFIAAAVAALLMLVALVAVLHMQAP